MKFKSELAQEAYEEISELFQVLAERAEKGGIKPKDDESKIQYTKLTLDIMSRAIEVAAKIEIEEKRLQFEMDLRCPPMGPVKTEIDHIRKTQERINQKSSECEHDFGQIPIHPECKSLKCKKCGETIKMGTE